MTAPPAPLLDDGAEERLSGAVERVTFHSEDSGFCVLRVKVRGQRELVTVTGSAASVAPGEYIEASGGWVNDRSYGMQFRSRHLNVVPPSTLEGIEKYLGSGMVKGIGPSFARKLVRAFGEQVFDVIEHQPERLTELDGIGPKRKARLTDAWAEQKIIRAIMVFLQSHGVGTARAVRIYKTYGDDAVELVRENPYRLALDIHGIGFRTADTIAQKLGIPSDSILRAQAGVRHTLQELSTQGHCMASREALVATAAELLGIPVPVIDRAVAHEIGAEHLIEERIDATPWVYLTPLQRAEVGTASNLLRLAAGEPVWDAIDPRQALPWVEQRTGLVLSASQRDAVARAVTGKLTVITGGPGVGKTTVVNSILTILRARRVNTLLAAPTGRAAKRLSESTGLEAKTLHRLLEFDPGKGRFKRDADSPLDADLIVVDEASMIDIVLANQLLRAIPDRAALLIVGDVDQLPSVGPGALLADVIASRRIPTARLAEIFRQAASSKIIINAHRINAGLLPERPADPSAPSDFYFIPAETPEAIHAKLLQVVTQRIPQRFGLHPVHDVQILTPMNRGGLGARSLNADLQQALNPSAEPSVSRFGFRFAPGDKVIQTVNDYDKEVFNGDIGRIRSVDLEDSVLHVDVDGRDIVYEFSELDELALAYATSVHKSQGSEYPAVVIPLSTQHFTLLERNLLYTAVTRGKRLVVVIGQYKALAMAVKTVRSGRRQTYLAGRLTAA